MVACIAGACQCNSQIILQLTGVSFKERHTFWIRGFKHFFHLNGQMWLMIKLSAELFTSVGRDFDTNIKFNASTGNEYFD